MLLKGHKHAVTALAFNADSTLLASGSQDTNIIIWDVVGESGLFRLRGHRDQVTDLCFIPAAAGSSSSSLGYLVSSSKDGYLKVRKNETSLLSTCLY